MRNRTLVVMALVVGLVPQLLAGGTPSGFRSIPNIGVQHYAPKTPQNSRYLPDRIIVKLKQGTGGVAKQSFGVTALDMFAQQYGARTIEQTFPNHAAPASRSGVDLSRIYTFRYDRPIDAFKVAKEFSRRAEVEYAEPWFIYQADGTTGYTPSDTSFAKQWALKKILADTAWTVSKGDTSVVIAIDDTGVLWDHPDLIGNIWYNRGEMGTDALGRDKRTNGVDDDGDGKIDDWHGWDFVGADLNNPVEDNDPKPYGTNTAHGTHVTGIAAAATDNVTGIAGVGFRCRFLPLKASADNDIDPITGLASIVAGFPAMVYAADLGAAVVNCSWGGSGYSQYEQDVVNYVTSLGTLVVAAAGNSNSSDPSFPASYANAISVAATNIIDARSGYSNYGYAVDVCAPGGDQATVSRGILSTYFGNTYAVEMGTSQATPHVSGLAGLVRSVFPALSPQQLGEQIRVTADDISAINGSYPNLLGKGRINALKALTTTPPSIRVTGLIVNDTVGGNGDGIPDPGETVSFTTTFTNFLHPTSVSAAAILSASDPYVQIVNSATNLGVINTLQDRVVSGSTFQFQVKPNTPPDHVVVFLYSFTDGSYSDFQWVGIICNPSYRTQRANNISVTFTSNGNIGFHDFPNNNEGDGFVYAGANQLFEGGIMIGNTASGGFVDNVRNDLGTQNADFLSHGVFTIQTPGLLADQEGHTTFSDSAAATTDQLGLMVTHTTYMYTAPLDADYVLLRYDIQNISVATLTNIYTGLFTDWDMLPAGTTLSTAPSTYYLNNRTGFDGARSLGYAWYDTSLTTTYCGVKALGVNGLYYGTTSDSASVAKPTKWRWISGPTHMMNGRNDVCFSVSSGPYTIPPGATQSIGFALVGGAGLSALAAHADAAESKWSIILASILGKPLVTISIHQNPAFTRFTDLYVSSDSQFTAAPVMKVDNGAGRIDSMTMTQVGGAASVYKTPYEFTSTGAKTISARVHTVGGTDTVVQKQFNATLAVPGASAAIAAPNGDMIVHLPAGAVAEETYVLSYMTEGNPDGEVFTFSPAREFLSPMGVEIPVAGNPRYIGKERFVHLLVRSQAGWKQVPAWIDLKKGIVHATVSSLGDFRIVVDERSPLGILPEEYTLFQNFPNPFNPQTRIGIALPADAHVRLKVYNTLGQQVRLLLDAPRTAGYQEIVWDGRDENGASVASGIYLYRAEFMDGAVVKSTAVRKMVVMK